MGAIHTNTFSWHSVYLTICRENSLQPLCLSSPQNTHCSLPHCFPEWSSYSPLEPSGTWLSFPELASSVKKGKGRCQEGFLQHNRTTRGVCISCWRHRAAETNSTCSRHPHPGTYSLASLMNNFVFCFTSFSAGYQINGSLINVAINSWQKPLCLCLQVAVP